MNKRMIKKHALEIIPKKYMNIGKMARKRVKTYTSNNIKVNYIEYDNVGLEFYRDEHMTYFRNTKDTIDFGNCSFNDFSKAFSVLQGFYSLKTSNK